MKSTFLCVGDLHVPFIDKKAFRQLAEMLPDIYSNAIKKNRKFYIIQMGDLFDMYSASKYVRSMDLMTPKEEFEQGRACAVEVWKILKKRAPKAHCYQLGGNHTDRLYKRLMEKCPELASLVSFKSLFEFDGVKTIHDSTQELIINNIVFMHGYRSKLGDHTMHNRMSTVCGHSHRGGVMFFPHKGEMLFELNAGYLADSESVPMRYSMQRISRSTHGFGLIDEYGPRFIPIE